MSMHNPAPAAVDAVIREACDRIAPNWPLDRLIAVNPHWGWTGQSFTQTGQALARLSGSPMWQSRSAYRDAWRAGRISRAQLHDALAEVAPEDTARHYIDWLDGEDRAQAPLPLLSDIVDARRDLARAPAWADMLTQQISQFCAAHFDTAQSDWRPDAAVGLYARWQQSVPRDHGIALLSGDAAVARRAEGLPRTPREAIAHALGLLQLPESRHAELLTALLLRINGWASWCAYRRWQARLQGQDDDTLVDLLAIRLGWECLLDDERRDSESAWAQWQTALRRQPAPQDITEHAVWQRALELAYQQPLCAALAATQAAPRTPLQPRVHAVFCIDVRSEVFRRALEACDPDISTAGFAGFFGLPIDYRPLGAASARPQLPGLLAPQLHVGDSSGDTQRDSAIAHVRERRMLDLREWLRFERQPASGFALVESLGLGYLGKLVSRSLGLATTPAVESTGLDAAQRKLLRPLLPMDAARPEDRVTLAERVLRAMSLARTSAQLVLLAGHGSRSANNAHAAGLQCGACGGHSGEVNARALAALLNDPEVRSGLVARGIEIPAGTAFVAGLHDTTTDELQLFDEDQLPAALQPELERLHALLREAGDRVRAERAASLGLDALRSQPEALLKSLRQRANDWAQTRPEWGLANNACFIAAPRARTRGLDLGGRSFLHEYDAAADTDGALLELIMTAPMVVAHWINLQYYASTVDNRRYGSGNKLLHNVVGGHIGVFEGNAGDLRIGLPLQSLHDGERWRHEPLRLSVFLEAPRERIEAVLQRHETVRRLVEGEWLFLYRLDATHAGVERWQGGRWCVADAGQGLANAA